MKGSSPPLLALLLLLPGCGPSPDYVSQYQSQLQQAVASGDKAKAQDAVSHLQAAANPGPAAGAAPGAGDPVARAAQAALDRYASAVAAMPDPPAAPAGTAQAPALDARVPDRLDPDYDGARKSPAALPSAPAASAIGRPAASRSLPASLPPPDYAPAPGAPPAGSPRFVGLIREAEGKLGLGDFSGALLAATQAKDEDPSSVLPHLIRAQASARLGNFSAAEQEAAAVLAREPQNAQALRDKAYAELRLGQSAAALEDLNRAVALEPGNATARFYRAAALQALGRTSEAVSDYDQAALLDPALKPAVLEALRSLSPQEPAPGRETPAAGLPLWPLAAAAFGALAVVAALARRRRQPPPPPSAFTRPSAPRDLAPGAILGKTYRVTSELGRGGMGVVYAADDLALQRRVAVKKLNRGPEDGAEAFERLLREARLVAKLRHPNIAAIYNVVADDEPYLVFELIEGASLDKTLERGRRLDEAAARRLISQVCSAVGYAHSLRIIHRDLKPSNVMVTPQGDAKVMDFGIAHQARGAEQTLTAVSGSPPYMAPEQSMGSVSTTSDLFALGAMAYELLAGRRPFDGPDFLDQKLRAQFAPPSRLDGGLPGPLDEFFAKALAPDPTKRFSSAAEFDAAFQKTFR